MKFNSIDLTGKKFGKLTAVRRSVRRTRWECICDCGNTTIVRTKRLCDGVRSSCGCVRKDNLRKGTIVRDQVRAAIGKARRENPRAYASWSGMKRRCLEPTNKDYHLYGGRGIKFSPRWEKFLNFLVDMKERPPGTTLDRKDSNGDYCLENCRWATHLEQRYNRRDSRKEVISVFQ